jgi:hypothetical protein
MPGISEMWHISPFHFYSRSQREINVFLHHFHGFNISKNVNPVQMLAKKILLGEKLKD